MAYLGVFPFLVVALVSLMPSNGCLVCVCMYNYVVFKLTLYICSVKGLVCHGHKQKSLPFSFI